jgi:pilus assembly protein Flp/PilA
MKTITVFLRDERATTSIEYALMASCIAVAIVAAVNGLGSKLKGSYQSVNAALN